MFAVSEVRSLGLKLSTLARMYGYVAIVANALETAPKRKLWTPVRGGSVCCAGFHKEAKSRIVHPKPSIAIHRFRCLCCCMGSSTSVRSSKRSNNNGMNSISNDITGRTINGNGKRANMSSSSSSSNKVANSRAFTHLQQALCLFP